MQDGVLYVATGSSRSGKTAWIKKRIARARRLLVWDPKPDYCAGKYPLKNVHVVRTKAELFKAVQVKGPARIVFHTRTDPALFGWWSRCAYVFARLAPAVIVAEETADVTSPGKAPMYWGELCRKVLGTGSDLYAVTQRPAESDKTAVGNAGVFHVCRMSRRKDRKYMAEELDVAESSIASLKADEAVGLFEFIEKDMRTHVVKRGKMQF